MNGKDILAPNIGIGLDALGFLKTAGVKFLSSQEVDRTHWYNKCFFVFSDCQSYLAFGGQIHHTDGSLTMIEKSNQQLEYRTGSGWMSSLSLGGEKYSQE